MKTFFWILGGAACWAIALWFLVRFFQAVHGWDDGAHRLTLENNLKKKSKKRNTGVRNGRNLRKENE